MGVIQVPGRLSGRTYNVDISGDTPTETERARILQEVETRESKFLQKYEQQFGTPVPEPEDGTALSRGIARGVPAAKSTLGTTIETIGDKTGIAAIADFGRGMEESAAQRQFELALTQPKPITRQDVAATEGFFPKIGAGLTYAGELAGSQIPQLGVGLAGGAAGAIGGFAVGNVPGAIAGFGIGSGLSEAPLLFGANVQRQEQEVAEGRKDKVDLGDALGATVGQAALTGIANAIGARGLTLVGGGLFTRAATGAALGAPVEGLNEVGQAVLERYQAGLPIDTPEAIQEYIDNGIAGGVLGGGLGASTGVVAGRGTSAAAEAAPTSISSRPVDKIAAAGVIPDATAQAETVVPTAAPGEAPIVTPAPTVTPAAPAPEYKINKIIQKPTGRKTGQKYKTTATVEGVGPVEVYTNKKFLNKNDPALQAAVANQINPTQVGEIGIDDVPRPPLDAYPEGNVSPKTVEVGKVGMDEVPFAPIGLDPAAAQADLFVAPVAPRTEAPPAPLETEAEALERAAEERKKFEDDMAAEADRRQAEADRRQAEADAAKAQAKPAQGDLFAAPEVEARQATTTQEATNVGEGTEAQLAETGVGTAGGTQGVGKGAGARGKGKAPEVTTASGTGRLADGVQSSDNAGATGAAEQDTLADVIPDAPIKRKKRTTPKNALEARLAALRDYFTPGNIVESYLGTDRVLSFDVDADGNWTVTVEAVKKENGQWVPKNKPSIVRSHRTEPKNLAAGPIERAKSVDEVIADATVQTATAVKLPMAAVASASALDKPLSYNTRAFLEEGDLKGALLSLSSETKNPMLKALAKRFSQLAGTTRIKVLYPGDSAKNIGNNLGVFWQDEAGGDPELQNIIYLNGQTGMTAHVLMHEMAHAVTVNIMLRFPNLPAMRQLQALFESVRAQAGQPGALGYPDELYGLRNLREFVAEAYGRVAFGPQDNGLRDLMNNTLFTDTKYETNELPLTNFERFKEIIGNFFRGLVGMPSKQYPRRKITSEVKTTETGLDRFHQIMDGLLSPAPQILPGEVFDKAVSEPLIGRNVLNNAGKVPTWSPSAASRMYDVIRESIPDWLRNFALSLQQIDWIADFSRKALPVIDDLKSILDRRQGELARLQKKVSQLPKRLAVLAEEAPEQFSRYTNILDTATRNEVDIAKPRNTYKDDAGKLFIWDKLTADMKAIDPNGKFREVYKLHYDLNESNRKEFLDGVTIAVDAVTGDPVERVVLRNKIMAQLIEGGVIDPYLPLMRKGDYWVSYVQTESTGKPPVAPGMGAKAPLFEAEKVVTPFKTPAAARAFIAQLNASKLPDGRPAAVEITQEPFLVDYSQGYDKTIPLEFVQSAVDIMNEVVPEASQREAGRIAIMELFTRMSPAYSAMARLRSRKDGGRAGAMGYESPVGIITEPHAYISALEDHLAGTVNTIVNVKFGPQLDAAKSRLQAQAENAQKDPTNTLADKIAINATANELNKRIKFARNPTASRPAYHTRGLTFLWTLGALPAGVMNVFFQMPMVIIPQLMGRHKVGDIARALNTARLITQSSGTSQVIQEPGRTDQTQVTDIENWGSLENYYSIDAAGNFTLRTDRKIPASIRAQLEELAPLAQYMSLNGMLGTTIAQSEITGMGDVASRVYRFSGLPLQYAERFTRQSTAVAAFVLEINKLKADQGSKSYKPTPEQINAAVKYAVDTTELTNGTVGVLTGPSAAFDGLGSVVLMYKRYALSMLRFIANGVQRSLTKITPSMTPEQVADAKMERKIARYQLGMMLGSTAIFAGIQGMPFFGEATTILDMIFTDDDEEDFATVAQKSLQQPLYSGLVNYLTGAEVASRISMSGLVFRESPIKKDQSIIYDLVDMFGGPVLGTANNMLRGIGQVNDGEVYRGIEAMVPSSIRAFMRAYRYAEAGGAETMRGDQITPLDSWDVAVQLLGYTPESVVRTQEAVGREKRVTEAIRSKKNKLYKRFNLALVDGDYEEVRQVQKEMVEFMREHPDAGGFDLRASARGFRQRSQDMVGGVYIPKQFQPRVRESLEEYDQEETQ